MAAESSSRGKSNPINPEYRNKATNIESARFLKRILEKAEQETKLPRTLLDFLDRTYFYTGLDKRTFLDKTKQAPIKEYILRDIERSLIQERLVAFYLNASRGTPKPDTTPTTKSLYSALYAKIPHYIDIRTFRKCLADLGYVWLKLAKGFIVMERPMVTFERYYYLKDITRYREENKEIFFVDETLLTAHCTLYNLKKYNSLLKSAAKAKVSLTEKGTLKYIYAVSRTGVHALKTIDDFTLANFEKWILNDLLSILPDKSVVVIQQFEHHDDVIMKPTLYSIRSDIIDWLERNNVPFDEDMSKCDLIDLVDTYTSEFDKVSKIETSLNSKGHELLRLPVYSEEMTPTKNLFDLIKLNAQNIRRAFELEEVITKIIESVPLDMLEQFDRDIATMEKDTLVIDMQMDAVLDNVVRTFQTVRLRDPEDSELPLSDSD